ncbi:MAG: hypothetical protein IKM29_03055 [Clostridia bacterium]|nr:hypothetical protein [Clostridia bacterium]
MRKTIKITALVLAAVLCLGLCACGDVQTPVSISESSTSATSAATVPTAESSVSETTAQTSVITEITTEPTIETTTAAVQSTTEILTDELGKPTPVFKAKTEAIMYAHDIISFAVHGPSKSYEQNFAASADVENLMLVTASLARECQLRLLVCDGEIGMLKVDAECGNFREENGVLVGNLMLTPIVNINGTDKQVFNRTLRLTFVPEGDHYLISDVEEIIPYGAPNIILWDIQNRTTFSELEFSCVTASESEEELLACEYISLWVENLVLGTDNDFKGVAESGLVIGSDLAAFDAMAFLGRGENFLGDPKVCISAQTVLLEENNAVVRVSVESGITAKLSGSPCSEKPADGVFELTMKRSNYTNGKWRVVDASVIEGDPNIAKLIALADAYSAYINSFPPVLY